MGMGYSDRLFDSQVEIDLEATKEWYSRGKEWGCECAHCRNFLELARNKQFPQQITDLLESFGIHPEQSTYVCQLYDDDKGHYYQFSYRIAGNLVKEANVFSSSAVLPQAIQTISATNKAATTAKMVINFFFFAVMTAPPNSLFQIGDLPMIPRKPYHPRGRSQRYIRNAHDFPKEIHCT